MPNRCTNVAIITAKKKTLDKIASYHNEKDGKFLETFYPTPKELRETTAPQFRQEDETQEQFNKRVDGYNKKYWVSDRRYWAVENRWTKRDIDLLSMERTEDSLEMVFLTAWSPPIKAFVKLSELHPDAEIELSYEEEWLWFSGSDKIVNWQIVDTNYFEDAFYGEWIDCKWCGSTHHKDSDIWIEVWKKCERCD